MTRTLARRLATVGGALGIAVLACAGTASADTATVSANTNTPVVAVHADVPAVADAPSVVDAPHVIVVDDWGWPCHHRGLVGDVLFDVGHLLHVLL